MKGNGALLWYSVYLIVLTCLGCTNTRTFSTSHPEDIEALGDQDNVYLVLADGKKLTVSRLKVEGDSLTFFQTEHLKIGGQRVRQNLPGAVLMDDVVSITNRTPDTAGNFLLAVFAAVIIVPLMWALACNVSECFEIL